MSDKFDCVVIGAGVVGLAAARAIARAGRQVLVLEKNERIGEETSSRNSEVIHAGIYYPHGSLKARLCVTGKQMLYEYCAEKNIRHERCGKVIVAIDETQAGRLEELARHARGNGVADLETLDADAVHALEPAVRGEAGLWSPSTGIVDSHALMLALQGDIEASGGIVAVRTQVAGIAVASDGIRVSIADAGDEGEIAADAVVNAGGLHSTRIAERCTGGAGITIPRLRYAKGHYFVYQGPSPFSHLVYPLPADGGLGVHATLDLDGRVRFGPDVEWVDEIDYAVDPGRAESFYSAIRTYWAELPDDSLAAGYAGIRPKLAGPGEPAADFRIVRDGDPDGPCLVHLFGIESPGLTAALAIGEHVADIVAR